MSEEITKIKLKRGIGSPSSLEEGEPAIDLETGDLYIGIKNNQMKRIPNIEEINEKISDIDSASQEDMESLIIKMERLQYYENADVIPTDEKYFNISEDGSLSFNFDIDRTELSNEIIIPYKVNNILVTKIANNGFNCERGDMLSSITDIIVPKSVTEIGQTAFYNTLPIQRIKIFDNCTKIGVGAFKLSGLREFKIPKGVTSIDLDTFNVASMGCNIYIHDDITYINELAFSSYVIIICNQGSYAETFAIENNISYKYDVVNYNEYINDSINESMANVYTKEETHKQFLGINNTAVHARNADNAERDFMGNIIHEHYQPKDFIVNLTMSEDGTITADIDDCYNAIMEAYNSGKNVYVKGEINGDVFTLPLMVCNEDGVFIFTMDSQNSLYVESGNVIIYEGHSLITHDSMAEEIDGNEQYIDGPPTTKAVAEYVQAENTKTLAEAKTYTDNKISQTSTSTLTSAKAYTNSEIERITSEFNTLHVNVTQDKDGTYSINSTWGQLNQANAKSKVILKYNRKQYYWECTDDSANIIFSDFEGRTITVSMNNVVTVNDGTTLQSAKSYTDEQIGDIETSLEKIITKYGLGGENV